MGPNQPDLPGLPGWPRDRAVGSPQHVDQGGTLMTPVPVVGVPALPPPPAPREPTLTEQIRAVQPPDVARQAVSELGVLARELDALPDRLAAAGLARPRGPAYRETVMDYVDLCHYAWDAVAEEQLEQAGAETEYREAAVSVARRITRLRQEADHAGGPAAPAASRRLPFLWRRRTHLIRTGLAAWQAQLAPIPDPLRMGRGLFVLQGYVGLANAGGLELALLDILVSTTPALAGLLTLGTLALLGSALVAGQTAMAPAYAALALTSALTWAVGVLLSATRALPLGLLLGASVFAPMRAACLGREGSPVVAGLLRTWWLLVGCVFALALSASVALGGVFLAANEPLPVPANALQLTSLAGVILYITLVLPVAVCIGALLALLLPFALTAQVRFVRELAGNVDWVPAARRYVMPAALAVVCYVTGLLLAIAWMVGGALGWQHINLLDVSVWMIHGTITLRALLYVLVLALPYVLLLDLPYRIGIGRWRAQRLDDLSARRADIESQVRRLATQEATDDVLRAMQYDLVLLQFYRAQIEEARATSAAPFRIEGRVVALVIAVASALALDGVGGVVIRLLVTPR